MPGPVFYLKFIYRADLKYHGAQVLFVFGDNLLRVGHGGQAREMRGEPNAIGLVTKRAPDRYLTNADLPEVIHKSSPDRARLLAHSEKGKLIIWPRDGIGTGLALLQSKAPAVAEFWGEFLLQLDPRSPLLVKSKLNPEDYTQCP